MHSMVLWGNIITPVPLQAGNPSPKYLSVYYLSIKFPKSDTLLSNSVHNLVFIQADCVGGVKCGSLVQFFNPNFNLKKHLNTAEGVYYKSGNCFLLIL